MKEYLYILVILCECVMNNLDFYAIGAKTYSFCHNRKHKDQLLVKDYK